MGETRNTTKSFVLNFFRQRGGKAIDVDFDCIPPFGLDEQLVAVPFGEAVDLVFDAGAVAGSNTLDATTKHGTSVKAGFEDIVDGWVGVGDPAASLGLGFMDVQKGEPRPMWVSPGCSTIWL